MELREPGPVCALSGRPGCFPDESRLRDVTEEASTCFGRRMLTYELAVTGQPGDPRPGLTESGRQSCRALCRPLAFFIRPTAVSRQPLSFASPYGDEGGAMLNTPVRMFSSTLRVRPRATHFTMSSSASIAADSPDIPFRVIRNSSRPNAR